MKTSINFSVQKFTTLTYLTYIIQELLRCYTLYSYYAYFQNELFYISSNSYEISGVLIYNSHQQKLRKYCTYSNGNEHIPLTVSFFMLHQIGIYTSFLLEHVYLRCFILSYAANIGLVDRQIRLNNYTKETGYRAAYNSFPYVPLMNLTTKPCVRSKFRDRVTC